MCSNTQTIHIYDFFCKLNVLQTDTERYLKPQTYLMLSLYLLSSYFTYNEICPPHLREVSSSRLGRQFRVQDTLTCGQLDLGFKLDDTLLHAQIVKMVSASSVRRVISRSAPFFFSFFCYVPWVLPSGST